MRTVFDLSPLHRASIGFDRVFELLETASRTQGDNWPPFDSVKLSDDQYRITMAVAGFTRDDLQISVQDNVLTVNGERHVDHAGEVLHRGIANRPFTRSFELADHMQVVSANLQDGLLVIDLKRDIPEALKPRRIAIGTESPRGADVRRLESQAA
ncbi:Hsp20 family protein [Dyella sedimenti]|uniref:Hsp20 family protein n=1 Tax=Dyella sedimenti TaxID=2919947 RepID=UPI001FA9AE6F|nr:Hsp20 family protein [Dyella sedimenti]